jgi:hypothetical protein
MYICKQSGNFVKCSDGVVAVLLYAPPVASNAVIKRAIACSTTAGVITLTLDGAPAGWAAGDKIVITARPADANSAAIFGLWQIVSVSGANLELANPALSQRGAPNFTYANWDGAWVDGVAYVINIDKVNGADVSNLSNPTQLTSFSSTDEDQANFSPTNFTAPPAGLACGLLYMDTNAIPLAYVDGSSAYKVSNSLGGDAYIAGELDSLLGASVHYGLNGIFSTLTGVFPDEGRIQGLSFTPAPLSTLLTRGQSFPKVINGDTDYSVNVSNRIDMLT